MNTSPNRPSLTAHNSKPRRRVLAALLLAAFALAVLAGSAHNTQARELASGPITVLNKSFEIKADGNTLPKDWDDFSSGIIPRRDCKKSVKGSCSLRFNLDDNTKIVQQVINVSGLAGETYKLDFWVKGKEVVGGGGAVFIGFLYHHVDGSNNFLDVILIEGTSAWEHIPSPQITAAEDYDYILIKFESTAESGKVWFDKVKLVEVP